MELNHVDARLLLVEDNPRYLALLRESLEDFGYQEIAVAETSEAAQAMLAESYFDVIVADMRMGDDRGGGFWVLNEIKARNITSIVLILTANDNVNDCRRAFREGTWDYISKNSRGDVFAILHESIRDALIYSEQWGNRKDELWIQNHREQLLKEYAGRYIAVLNNSVIDTDTDEAALRQRIRERKLPLLIPVIHQVQEEALEQLPVDDLIKRGESEHLEFKSTLQCNVRDNNKNEAVVMSSIKTIAAFLNSNGGILLIGVEDNGNIFGLDADIALLGKRKDLDGFEQKLVGLMTERIGAAFMQFVKIEFQSINTKTICIVRVTKAGSPAFTRAKDKNGNPQKYFFVRAGCTTRALDVEDIYQHMLMKMKVVLAD
ncbi:response regulator [Candidatus Venteria ishoeyi]|uniref:response regulator n=1 Tax=Candidatus Venteria ishoeyi TaxID=1899563 RepID=UPI0025A5FFBA|nr:response regulator [Candidatus Venteria ishoeyi]MDM8547993.1 response regulator [Candidatus Venteria ishoeyi]